MNRNAFSFLFVVMIFIVACSNKSNNQGNKSSILDEISANPNLKLQIYYFYPVHRCATCLSIEENVKKVLADNYKDEVSKGIINLKVLCVDDKANRDLTEKYEAAGAALHLVKVENGKEKDHDLTEYAFSYSNIDADYFKKGVQDTIRSLINN